MKVITRSSEHNSLGDILRRWPTSVRSRSFAESQIRSRPDVLCRHHSSHSVKFRPLQQFKKMFSQTIQLFTNHKVQQENLKIMYLSFVTCSQHKFFVSKRYLMDKFNDDYKLLLFTLERKHPTLTRDYLRLVYLIVVTVRDKL